jgi:hypothetical protein
VDSPKTFYVTGVAHGSVLAQEGPHKSDRVVMESKGRHGDEQKWTIEYGDEPNVIALKCAGNGKYLHCFTAERNGRVATGDKQWWRMSNDNVTPPGACALAPVDYPKFFLTFTGNAIQGNSSDRLDMSVYEFRVGLL